ncbi:MAG: ATP-dependent DNA ligase [Candidatus Nealsonbacteria bacterium]|nr:ATP-dependent DNA ligase [Candidatus Nealsonbacteria bacterium]
MQFKILAQRMKKLESISSRNKMIEILSNIFNEASEEEIGSICYFLLGQIYPSYIDTTLGLGDKMIQSAISLAADVRKQKVEDKIKEMGDLGEVAAEMIKNRKNRFKRFFDAKNALSVKEVKDGLEKIAEASGEGSQDVKKKTLAAIFIGADKIERKYIGRLVAGTMRLGLGDMTILDALSVAFFGDKSKRPELEHAYNVSSDIGYVAEVLKKSGLPGVERIRVSIDRPLKPMLAQRVSQFSDVREKISSKKIAAEEKYDGERVQVHKNRKKVTLFSRRLNDITSQFPDVVENVKKNVEAEKAILDGEVVAYDFEKKGYYPFQKIMHRRRKYEVEEYAEKIPVKYMLFDIMYLNGRSMMREPYQERRKKLKEVVGNKKYIALAGRKVSSNLDRIEDFFKECMERDLEGIVCKSCSDDSYYRAGAREWTWIKWKREYASELGDTLDLVVVGAYAGHGKRAHTYGSLLCAAYNYEDDAFETVSKLGTGLTDKQLNNLPHKLGEYKRGEKPVRVRAQGEVEPDFWFSPSLVLEVKAAEITRSPVHTCGREKGKGLALRFPRFKRWRPDKEADQATTTKEIVEMYEQQ